MYIEYNGELTHVNALSDKYNKSSNLILSRLNAGWSLEKTLNTPVKGRFICVGCRSPHNCKSDLCSRCKDKARDLIKNITLHILDKNCRNCNYDKKSGLFILHRKESLYNLDTWDVIQECEVICHNCYNEETYKDKTRFRFRCNIV